MGRRMIRGFNYRTRTPFEVPLSAVREEIAKARAAGTFARIGGDAVVMHTTERGLEPAIEYYDQELAR